MGVHEYHTQGIVDFMGNACGQSSNGGELFGSKQLLLGFHEFLLHFKSFSQVHEYADRYDLLSLGIINNRCR